MLVVLRIGVASLVAALLLLPPSGAAQPAPPSPATLLARHVPVLVLHPAEQLGPVSVEGFLADADLQRRAGSAWETVAGPLPAGGADHRLDQRLCRAFAGPAATPCYASAQAARGSLPVVYGAVFRTRARIALQYWLWYPFNAYSPSIPASETWQAHEGDWESVSLLLDLRGRPLLVGLSQHGEGVRRDWARAPKRGLRPLVFVALGSHANYFTAGRHVFDPRVVEPLLIRIIRQAGEQPVDTTGSGRVVRPRLVRVSARSPSWMTFAGRWGEDQYLHVPGSEPQAFGGGPTGPAFKEQWRRAVADVLGWPQE